MRLPKQGPISARLNKRAAGFEIMPTRLASRVLPRPPAPGIFMMEKILMAEIKIISTKAAPAAIGPYVQGKIVGGLLFASGQVPLVPETGKLAEGGIDAQARQALTNVKALVEAAGSSMDRVLKTTCYLKNISDFAAFNEIYAEFFPQNPPARSCVGGIDLPKDALCEIEVIALA